MAGSLALRAIMLAGSACALLAPVLAQAQVLPPANAVSPPTREEIERGVVQGALEQAIQPIAVDDEIERAPCALANPEFADIRLTLSEVTFTGTEAIPEVDLSGSWADFKGRDLPVATICEIRDRAATQLRRAGYLAAVQVPPQSIEGGKVRLDVLLARMTKVQIRGDAGANEGLLAAYLDKLTQDPVFNITRAERYLLLARDIPGLEVRLALRPLEGRPGEVLGEVSVNRAPFVVDANIQNLGSRAVGRWGGLLRARFNGLTGMGDSTVASIFSTVDTDEQQVANISHSMFLGSEGFQLSGDFTYAWTRPTLDSTQPIDSTTLVAGLSASYPLVRSQASNLTLAGGFEHVEQDVDFGPAPLTRDTLNVAWARISYNSLSARSITGRDGFSIAEPNWRVAAYAELRQGLDILGTSPGCGPLQVLCGPRGITPPSRLEGDPTAFVVRAGAELEYRPEPDFALVLAPRLQYSPDALLSYEEISAGNYTIGRGYDAGTLTGDSGIGMRGELRFGSLVPASLTDNAFQPYLFLDGMMVWNKDLAFAGLDPQELYSGGAGVRANLANGVRVDAMLAVPLSTPFLQTRRGDARFLINVTMQLFPWPFR